MHIRWESVMMRSIKVLVGIDGVSDKGEELLIVKDLNGYIIKQSDWRKNIED